MEKCIRKEAITAGSKKLHSAESKFTELEIAIVDQRVILRDAIADSIRPALGCKVMTIDSADSLAQTSFRTSNVSSQIVIFSDSGIDPSESKQELEKLRDFFPNAKMAIITDHSHCISYHDLKKIGVRGVIPSCYNKDQLVAVLKTVELGIECIPPNIVENSKVKSTRPTNSATGKVISDILTPRQQQIMDFIAIGRSNKYVAAELSLSESTVKVHVHNIMKHLGATNRTHATHIINEMHEREMQIYSISKPAAEIDDVGKYNY